MEDPVRDLPIVAGVPVARPEMDVIAQTIVVIPLTVAVTMTAAEVTIANVALTDTGVEVKPRFTNKAQPINGLNMIKTFHLDTSRSLAEHCLSAE
jgi:hypothetical protein